MRRRLVLSARRLQQTMTGSPAVVLEPIDLATTKKVLRWQTTSEDDLIAGWIVAARQHVENQSGRQILSALWEVTLDGFPLVRTIELPRPPLLEVLSITYDDSGGTPRTLDPGLYRVISCAIGSPKVVVEPFCPRGRIELTGTGIWPQTLVGANVVRIQFRAGYGDTAEDVPGIVKAPIYDLVRLSHARTDGDLPLTTKIVLDMLQNSAIDQVLMEQNEAQQPWPRFIP